MSVTNSANNFVNDVDVLDYGFLEGEFYSHILLSAISWESFVVHLVYEREFQVHEEKFSELSIWSFVEKYGWSWSTRCGGNACFKVLVAVCFPFLLKYAYL